MRIGTAIVVAASILALGSVSTAGILALAIRGTVAVRASASPSVSTSAGVSPSGNSTIVPSALPFPPAHPVDPSLNFAGGDFIANSGFTDCMVHVNFAATSRADGTQALGTLIETVVGSQNCSGKVTAHISCLLVHGSDALFDGWADNPTGIFGSAQIIMGTVTEQAPQQYGPPVDRAGLGIADGSPECPPPISGPGGPAIRSGTIVVTPARA